MGTEFRRAGGVWHWCTECLHYPDTEFESIVLESGTPEEELCPECRGLDFNVKCPRPS